MSAFLSLIDPPGITEPDHENDQDETDEDIVRVLDLADVKTHLRITNETEDDYIRGLIDAATAGIDGADGWLGRALLTQTWKLTLDCFPCWPHQRITIPLPPLQEIVSIKYIDVNGTQQTLSDSAYRVISDSHPATVEPVYGTSWPATRHEHAAVEIEFVCGYGDAAEDVPGIIRQFLKIAVGDFYRDRESSVIGQSALSSTVSQLPYISTMLDNLRIRGALHNDGWQARQRD